MMPKVLSKMANRFLEFWEGPVTYGQTVRLFVGFVVIGACIFLYNHNIVFLVACIELGVLLGIITVYMAACNDCCQHASYRSKGSRVDTLRYCIDPSSRKAQECLRQERKRNKRKSPS